MKTSTPQTIHLKNYQPAPYLIKTVYLDVSLHPSTTVIVSKLKIAPNKAAIKGKASGKSVPLMLDGENIKLLGIKIGGRVVEAAQYSVDDRSLTIKNPPQKAFTLEITTQCDPEANKALSGLYRSSGVYCTQCEAEGFRRITYFLDRPDVLATYKVRIEADKAQAPILLSNGNLTESGKAGDGSRHFAVWEDPHPKPSYLFALVGGDLALKKSSFKTRSGRKVDLRIYVEPGKEDRCDWAMDCLKRSMRWDEKRFGREYDLDIFNIVAVSDFNMGAMENKSLNVFNDRLVLASPDTAADGNYAAIESVIAHEYFHNWTGNRITCRDWFQLCLKEGLTVFRDQEFSMDERSRTVARIDDVRMLKAHQFPEDSGPLAHPVRPASYIEINNFYTATVYQKGAEVCRMIHTILGEKGFRAGMDLYFDRHDGEAATVEDFLKSFEDANKVDLSQFALWYSQAGTPELVASFDYNETKKTAKLTFEQVLQPTPGQSRKKPMHIPVRMGLVGPSGKDITLKTKQGDVIKDGVLHLRKRREIFEFVGISERPVPSLVRGFSAPVNLTLDMSSGDLAFLMAHDSDLYNRWQAAQIYATRRIIEMVDAIRSGKRLTRGKHFSEALALSIEDEKLEPAYRALCMQLPSETDIARVIGRDVDPGAIHKARKAFAKRVASDLAPQLKQIYKSSVVKGDYSPDAKSAGLRSLRISALSLLSNIGSDEQIRMIGTHYRSAKNMTDQSAALMLLADFKHAERDKALSHFYKRYKKDHLVIDKWFSIQAMSSASSTLNDVKKLLSHELFSIKNPNKVRSLIGAFASFNATGFHRADGAGYNFIAEQVLEIDSFNPQVASRMLSSFRNWRTLKAGRQKLARKALQRIARRKTLSPDVYEIVTKMLG